MSFYYVWSMRPYVQVALGGGGEGGGYSVPSVNAISVLHISSVQIKNVRSPVSPVILYIAITVHFANHV